MILLKKLILAPLFLITFGIFFYQLAPLLKSYDFIFSLSSDTLIQLIVISAFISLSSLLFVVFATIASDWKLVLPVILIGTVISLLFIQMPLGLIFIVVVFVSLVLSNVSLDNTLNCYFSFQPNTLLGPVIRHLSGLLIISVCLIYFLSANKIIAEKGFEIPDSIIDTALKMTPMDLPTEQNSAALQLPSIATDLIKNTVKQAVKDQVQGFIKPYQSFIPAILAVLLFLTLQSLTSIINLLIYPLLWLIFLIFEKTGFTKFETETREVKKLVI